MSKSAVIYWSGTGNTEAMAQAVLDGLNGAGEDAALFSADSVRAADAVQYDKLALGCPAMGAEVLEESVFEPFFTELEPLLSGKKSRPLRLLRLGRRTVDARLAGPLRGRGGGFVRRGSDSERGARRHRSGGMHRSRQGAVPSLRWPGPQTPGHDITLARARSLCRV